MDSQELKIALLVASVLLAANFLIMLLFILFAKLPNGRFRESIRSIIFELDKFADQMENVEKRQAAIQQVSDVLGWRKIFIPVALIGWVIDAEVAAIRKMQNATNTPDLHVEEESGDAKGYTSTGETTGFKGQE